RDGPPPGDLARHLEPLRMLVEHRVDDVNERLVAVEETVATGEQVALQPALAEMLGQDLEHASLGRDVLVRWQDRRLPDTIRRVEDRAEAIRIGLVRSEEPKGVRIPADHVPKK